MDISIFARVNRCKSASLGKRHTSASASITYLWLLVFLTWPIISFTQGLTMIANATSHEEIAPAGVTTATSGPALAFNVTSEVEAIMTADDSSVLTTSLDQYFVQTPMGEFSAGEHTDELGIDQAATLETVVPPADPADAADSQ